jgi:hypothetical protein
MAFEALLSEMADDNVSAFMGKRKLQGDARCE